MGKGGRVLIVVTGPIAAGKSTFAARLADEVRSAGRSVAVVDLDEVVFMVRNLPDTTLEELWDMGRTVHARLVDAFVRAGIEVVIVDGPFHDDRERAALLDVLALDGDPVWITLVVSYEEALRRARADSSRGLSKDPDFLRRTHDVFWAARATLVAPEPTHDTEHVSAGDLARTVAAGLPLSTGSGWEPD